ncbi:multidrug resistance-associated protein, partial [Asbolus verrucosus]
MEDKQRTQLNERKQTIHPKQRAGLWALPLFVKGFKKDLTEDDLYGPLKVHESRRLGDKLEEAWKKQENSSRNPSLWKALTVVFGKEIAKYGLVLALLEFVVKMSQPLFIGKLMEYYTPNQTAISKKTAYIYASSIVLMSFINVMFGHSYMMGLQHLGMKIRVACCSLIYRKSLRLSKSALVETTVGQMVNLLSNDVNRFDFAVIHLHNLWVAPIETVIVMYLLYTTLGPASITGIGILLLFIPLQFYLGKRTSVYRLRTALKTDQRVRLMNEIITGIQVIKMYTWEKPFAKLVEVARKLEIHHIKATSYIRAINLSLMMFLNRTAIFLCVLTYVLTGNTLQSQYVFVVTSFYGILRQALTMFLPQGVTTLAETNVSINRIQKFLMYEEVENKDAIKIKADDYISKKKSKKERNGSLPMIHEVVPEKNIGIYMEGASVKWVSSSPDYTLNNVSVNVGPNQLIAIVGPVGCGKTTLLHVILKELSLIKGSLDVGGTISYASQEPWLFGGSIKQNILFGQKMDLKRYKEVVRVCALERDFSLFPYGDRTIVGERGTMLSGGQKARINLARSIYKEADIYLLDDPLSAVDTHVGKQLFDDCISSYLKNKCVVLVTHQLQYLRTVDRIYLLENGSVATSGTYSQLKDSEEEFLKLLEDEPEGDEDINSATVKKAKSSKSLEKIDLPTEIKEQRGTGTISSKIYKNYLRAGGNIIFSLLIGSLFVLTQLGGSGADYFLTFWVNLEQKRLEDKLPENNVTSNDTYIKGEFEEMFFTTDNCLYMYSAIVAYVIFMSLTRSLSFFKFCMKASRNLHNNMFSKIVHASMRFFNTNSSGRILNRFSKDMGSIDETLPIAIMDTIQIGLIAVAIVIVISTINPWILIPTIIIFGLFYTFRFIFLATSRNLKRIEGTTRSPVFTHMTASLQGLTTIRAFGAQEILRIEFDQHQDLHSSAFYMFLGCNRTFGFWLDLHCVIYIALVTLSFLFIGNETYGGNVGLGITQSITLTGMLQWGMRQWSELENQMTSVERVVEYTEIKPEPDNGTKIPPNSWPSKGNIDFQSVSMQYASDEPMVLKKLTFQIKSGEKIGIVGRTGAGKSSLISALFRLTDIQGAITIDSVDTKQILLHDLRSKISIIPQEPVLFSGTLRNNLDPFDEYDDAQLWDALEEVELKNVVSDLPSGLQTKVSEGGSNFSVGQRQLLCLARAVVRSNKILILDEATANVDPQTDELIQATIRRKFKDCTVLTIAHRLHTVMDSDKILVMEAGHAAEFDHPHVLLQNENGIFYGLVKQTGKGMAENLMKIAEE